MRVVCDGDDDRPYPMPRTHIEGRVSRIERGKVGHRSPATGMAPPWYQVASW